MKISVIVPTYKRTDDLAKCLQALQNQTRPADELILIVRDIDNKTQDYLKKTSDNKIKYEIIKTPGQVAALNRGFEVSQGDIIAITDDDAAPHEDWLKKIEAIYLKDEQVGGVGGKDNLHINGYFLKGKRDNVGAIEWYGRITGNHHLGHGNKREVDHLKGANMSFKRAAIAENIFDKRLLGDGAQVRNDTAMCLSIKRSGWKIIYDPSILVEHFMGKRFEKNKRGNFNHQAIFDGAHNETLIILEYLPFIQKIFYFIYIIFVGNKFTPGILIAIRLFPEEKGNALRRLFAAYQGRVRGFLTWASYRNRNGKS